MTVTLIFINMGSQNKLVIVFFFALYMKAVTKSPEFKKNAGNFFDVDHKHFRRSVPIKYDYSKLQVNIDVLREAFKNKNDETYGIFHMLVDPPPLPTYGKFFHDFLLSKKDF